LGSGVALDQGGAAFTFVVRAQRVKHCLRHAQLCLPRKKGREGSGKDLCRNHEHQAIWNGDQASADEDISLTISIVRSDELVSEAEGATEFGSPGFLRDERIGASLDYAPVDAV